MAGEHPSDESTPREQGAASGPVDARGEEPTARSRARAERREERRRRAEERRRRWSGDATSNAAGVRPAPVEGLEKDDEVAAGGGTVLTLEEREPHPDLPEGARDDGDAPVAAPVGAPVGAVEPARGVRAAWQLVVAAHPRQALVTAAALAAAATLAGRPASEVGTLAAMVLIGQVMLGWHNDLVDRDRDAAAAAGDRADGADGADAGARRSRPKPLAEGRLEPGTVWYALALALLLLAPVSVANGVDAALAYAVCLVLGMLGNVLLRGGWLSWLPWAASYALYPVVLAYAGPPGTSDGAPPEPALVVLAALLGVVVHVLRALPGLVHDNRAGLRHLPLRIALRTGAPRLLLVATTLAVALSVALVVTGVQLGLTR